MAENSMMIPLVDVPSEVEKCTGWRPNKITCKLWLDAGKVDGRKIGGRWFVNRDSLDSLLNGKEDTDEVQA